MGGDATLVSYGFDPESFGVHDLEKHFPSAHLNAFRRAERYVELPNHLLVHAGLNPGVPLEEQTAHDLMWIRNRFLTHTGSFGKTVVHGHTITASTRCEVMDNRIALDTGAYSSGRLSAAWIAADQTVSFLCTEVDGTVSVGVQPIRLLEAA